MKIYTEKPEEENQTLLTVLQTLKVYFGKIPVAVGT